MMEQDPIRREETGLSEELQQRQHEFLKKREATLTELGFTEEEDEQGEMKPLRDILEAQDWSIGMLKNIASIQKDMRRYGFDNFVEWLICEGNLIPPPSDFKLVKRPRGPFRRELHQLYRDKVKEVIRYWREQGFL